MAGADEIVAIRPKNKPHSKIGEGLQSKKGKAESRAADVIARAQERKQKADEEEAAILKQQEEEEKDIKELNGTA